ncbi:hypothetical protein [Novosphingobium lindaniclasticum]|uniref:Uncharacterized protein n=1 Tax=Novosphingobium lindaniclasticum LE124 TaxID=1096930 RepID=T0H9Q0_9SPHN|nr:hypothetical protein [Novosphingobium lindaniclasticum]EQB09737.1 hypothetical protein L284_19245 [Novosphingobium lindaniclasticum LE124]
MDRAKALLSLARVCEGSHPWAINIDCAVFATLYPDKFSNEDSAAQYARLNWTRNLADRQWLGAIGMLQYSASLDAAMTLVPAGCLHMTRTIWDAAGKPVGLARIDKYEGSGAAMMWADGFDAVAATPALALCAAVLRARAAEVANG